MKKLTRKTKPGPERNPANYRKTFLGPEKRCARCHDWWPEDTEFFHRQGTALHSYCKACVTERCLELRGGLTGWAYQAAKKKRETDEKS